MGRFLNEDKMQVSDLGNNFKFSGVRTEHLGATEYTLVNVAVDTTGSVSSFKDQLRDCLIAAVDSCKKSPRADNILLRVFLFNAYLNGGITEVHGYKPLAEITTADYPQLNPGGTTNLFDAAYSAVAATNAYAAQLFKDDYACNAINFVITDGEDNASTMTAETVKREIQKGITSESLESSINVLIGVNDANCKDELEDFQKKGGFDKYIPAGDATPSQLAKLADFVSQSISSQSTSLGTGGPSQNIAASI